MPEVKTKEEYAESFLSGGVDSSYVLAMSDVETTDSCGYDEERFDESGLAKQTADILGRKNLRCRITPEEYFAVVPYGSHLPTAPVYGYCPDETEASNNALS